MTSSNNLLVSRAWMLIAACLLICAGRTLDAQTTGSIRGRVLSEARQPLRGTLVRLRAPAGDVQSAITDTSGGFAFTRLAAGSYTLSVEHVGYKPLARVVAVHAGAETRIDVPLAIAPVALSRIEVMIPPVEIRKDQTEFGTALTERQLKLLPIPRTASEIVAFTPGARPGQVWGGSTAQANNYIIDGLPANDPGTGGELVQPSVRWIDRIEVLGLGAGAEYGNFQGGMISITTKSGSNDFGGSIYTSAENGSLSSSNLGRYEIGAQITGRYQVGGELRGAVVPDHLFYFLSGEFTDQDREHIDHLHLTDDRFSPTREQRTDQKLFGKLTWQPRSGNLLEVSAGRINADADHFEAIGYEAADATLRYSAPSGFINAAWTYNWRNTLLEVKASRYVKDDRRDPYQGDDVPSLQIYSLLPPYTYFQNAPIRYRHYSATRQASATVSYSFNTGAAEHRLKVGGEYVLGDYIDQRKRNGAVTWMPVRQGKLDITQPVTWTFDAGGTPFLPSLWGGEVDLDADVVNAAVFVQDYIGIGRHLSINPGLRLGRWTGGLTPAGGAHIDAVRDAALDPRLGVVYDVTGKSDFVLKAHWGRFHQSMFAQFYDRVAGGNVFNNQELWYYWNPAFTDPTYQITQQQRDALAQNGTFQLVEQLRLNETGRVENYKQPYIDQWLLGLEKMLGPKWKFKSVYIHRANRDMVALQDRNIASNYTSWANVLVYPFNINAPVDYNGRRLLLPRFYLPNDELIRWMKLLPEEDACCVPPGLKLSDTLTLHWNPDYVLGVVDQARRSFHQFQMQLETSQQSWGANASIVWTSLKGNWDNVSGYEKKSVYDDPARYTAGPFVHPNESVNFYGPLEGYSSAEWKLSVYGQLPWNMRGGAYWNWGSGDHFTPIYYVTPLLNQYRMVNRDSLQSQYALAASGQRIMIEPRGALTYPGRATLDLHLERDFPLLGALATLTFDVFNLFNNNSITQWNDWVNNGKDYYRFLNPTPWKGGQFNGEFAVPLDDPNSYYKAPRERIAPRVLRVGTSLSF